MPRAWWAVVAVVLCASAAQADAENIAAQAAHGKATYGLAGCGLGSLVFGDQKGGVQILAATTNGTFGSQTFGISTGTSNCVENDSSTTGARAFIEGNREALAKDAARGGGETVTALSTIAGCKDAKAVGAALQKRFAQLFPAGANASAVQVSQNVTDDLRADRSLACKNLG
jgi:opacity protein-like surface antigen